MGSTTQNNGKITSETDVVSGETVTYTYDSLNRLASATSSVNPGWGQGFTYDGFGNLTKVRSGLAQEMSPVKLAIILASITLPGLLPPVVGQSTLASSSFRTFRDEVLEKSFVLNPQSAETRIRMVIRFEPSFSPESQLLIDFDRVGAQIQYLQLDRPLTVSIEEIAAEGIESFVHTHPARRQSKTMADTPAKQLLRRFWTAFDRVPKRLRESVGLIQLDGTKYTLLVETGTQSFSISVNDEETTDSVTGKSELVRWMNSLRLSLQ